MIQIPREWLQQRHAGRRRVSTGTSTAATACPQWAHLNKVLALACGQRETRRVVLDVYRTTGYRAGHKQHASTLRAGGGPLGLSGR